MQGMPRTVYHGMDVVNDRLGNMRYSGWLHNLYNWFAWYYDPVSFSGNATDQWYHVIQVADTTTICARARKPTCINWALMNFAPRRLIRWFRMITVPPAIHSWSIQSLADATKNGDWEILPGKTTQCLTFVCTTGPWQNLKWWHCIPSKVLMKPRHRSLFAKGIFPWRKNKDRHR